MSDEMAYGHLGRSGLLVSRIGLGTMNFGFTADESASSAIMDAAIDAGINFFDSADVYGGPQTPDMEKGYGISEEIIGRWLQRSGRRDDIVLATKVYQPMGLGPNDRRLSAYHIRRACEASLRRLQTDHIDLYQMHHVDRVTPWEEVWQAMEQLVREGKISYVGSSNFAAWDVALAQCAASARHFMGLTSEQSLYNLAVRTVELELIPALRSLGIGLIPYSPLHAGLLAGALEAGTRTTASRRTATSSKRMKGCAGNWARSRRTSPWPGCCEIPSSPPRSSDQGRAWSCGRASARCRCSWTPVSWNDSTRSGRGRGKPHRRTPGKADPRPRARARRRGGTPRGAGAVHVHPRDQHGRETLVGTLVDAAVATIRRANPGIPVGVSTGAWVLPAPTARGETIATWREPDFAGVNLSEAGHQDVIAALTAAGIAIEAGIWTVEDVVSLVRSGYAPTATAHATTRRWW